MSRPMKNLKRKSETTKKNKDYENSSTENVIPEMKNTQ